METFSSKKLPSLYNKQEQNSSSINSTKTKIKLLSHYPDKHYQTSLNLQQSLIKTHKSEIEDMNLPDIRLKILKDYLLKNNQIDRHVMLMILQPPKSYNQEQSYEKVLLRQLSHKVKMLIEQNKRLHKQSQQKIQTTQIMLRIQKINQNNINTMKQQQQMINHLQMKLNTLDEVRQYLKQLKFQKIVKLQQSCIKNKIEIIKCPPSTGQSAFTNQIFYLNVQNPIQLLNKQDQTAVQCVLHEQQRELHKKNEKLREQLQLLRQKLDNELQTKFNMLGQKEQLQMNLQKLKEERKQYQFMLNQANEQLKQLLTKSQQSDLYLNLQQNKPKIKNHEYQTIPVISQLKDIKNMLIKCNKNNIHSLQVQLLQLIQERNQYRREYLKLKNKIMYNDSKNQVKFLMDKNIQLQQKCCFYEKEIDRYEIKLREMMEERQNNAVDNMIKDFEDMNKGDKDDLGLKYSRATHTCIINTINRLEQLEKTLMN